MAKYWKTNLAIWSHWLVEMMKNWAVNWVVVNRASLVHSWRTFFAFQECEKVSRVGQEAKHLKAQTKRDLQRIETIKDNFFIKIYFYYWCNPRFTDSSNLQLLQKLVIGKSIHASFTDWGYLDLAMVVHLFIT